MNALGRALSAELLKIRRTLALLMTVLAPLIIAVLQFAMYIQGSEYHLNQVDRNQWQSLNQSSLLFWSLLMMPLFVTLETALLNGLEYDRKNWALLYTMPAPRWAFYAAKMVIGLILQAINPGYGLTAATIPWAQMGQSYALLYGASFLMVSIHLWVSSRWPNYVVAFGAGIAATVTTVLVFEGDLARFFPWSMPGLLALSTVGIPDLVMSVPLFLAIGAGGGLLVALLGGWHIARRDVL